VGLALRDDRSYRVIGKSLPRPDAWEKVRGRPIYAGDLALSGMLHGLTPTRSAARSSGTASATSVYEAGR
jgi:CO/xanthine dehydrogenase Mo-binding subunit